MIKLIKEEGNEADISFEYGRDGFPVVKFRPSPRITQKGATIIVRKASTKGELSTSNTSQLATSLVGDSKSLPELRRLSPELQAGFQELDFPKGRESVTYFSIRRDLVSPWRGISEMSPTSPTPQALPDATVDVYLQGILLQSVPVPPAIAPLWEPLVGSLSPGFQVASTADLSQHGPSFVQASARITFQNPNPVPVLVNFLHRFSPELKRANFSIARIPASKIIGGTPEVIKGPTGAYWVSPGETVQVEVASTPKFPSEVLAVLKTGQVTKVFCPARQSRVITANTSKELIATPIIVQEKSANKVIVPWVDPSVELLQLWKNAPGGKSLISDVRIDTSSPEMMDLDPPPAGRRFSYTLKIYAGASIKDFPLSGRRDRVLREERSKLSLSNSVKLISGTTTTPRTIGVDVELDSKGLLDYVTELFKSEPALANITEAERDTLLDTFTGLLYYRIDRWELSPSPRCVTLPLTPVSQKEITDTGSPEEPLSYGFLYVVKPVLLSLEALSLRGVGTSLSGKTRSLFSKIFGMLPSSYRHRAQTRAEAAGSEYTKSMTVASLRESDYAGLALQRTLLVKGSHPETPAVEVVEWYPSLRRQGERHPNITLRVRIQTPKVFSRPSSLNVRLFSSPTINKVKTVRLLTTSMLSADSDRIVEVEIPSPGFPVYDLSVSF